MKKIFFTKIITAFLILSTLVSQGLFRPLEVEKAHAGASKCGTTVSYIFAAKAESAASGAASTVTSVPVNEVTIQSNTAGAKGAAEATFFDNVGECLLNFLKETLRKQLLDMIVSQIINWIQGGGSPKFVTDWQGFLEDAGNIAIGSLIEQTDLAFLCKPFALQIRAGLRLGAGRGVGFGQRISCTLDKIVGNIQNFSNNFSNGGWGAFIELTEAQNNYIGVSLMVSTEAQRRNSRAQNAAYAEAQAGGGFLGTKQCQEAYGPWQQGGAPPDIDGDGNPGDIPSTCRTTTPGQTIGALASKAVGSDIDYIINAQELEQYVSAIADAAINRLIREGAGGLARITTTQSPQGGSIPPGQSGCGALQGQTRNGCNSYLNPTFQNPPTSPTALRASSNATSTIRLTWNDNATTETSYQVERSFNYVDGYSVIAFNLPPNTTDYTNKNLTSGTRYYYRVRAINQTGVNSDYSNVVDQVAQ